MSVKLATGYVNIKGAGFQEWIDSNFCSVSKFVPIENQVVVEEETDESERCSASKTEKHVSNECDEHALLWEENQKLRNAINILETSFKSSPLTECKCRDTLDELEEKLTRAFDQKYVDLGRLYDEK